MDIQYTIVYFVHNFSYFYTSVTLAVSMKIYALNIIISRNVIIKLIWKQW